jgi:myo-inositol catabolism protein IolC
MTMTKEEALERIAVIEELIIDYNSWLVEGDERRMSYNATAHSRYVRAFGWEDGVFTTSTERWHKKRLEDEQASSQQS